MFFVVVGARNGGLVICNSALQ